MTMPTDEQIIAQARMQIGSDGYLEVPDFAAVSIGSGGEGAFVQCWMWVEFKDIKDET